MYLVQATVMCKENSVSRLEYILKLLIKTVLSHHEVLHRMRFFFTNYSQRTTAVTNRVTRVQCCAAGNATLVYICVTVTVVPTQWPIGRNGPPPIFDARVEWPLLAAPRAHLENRWNHRGQQKSLFATYSALSSLQFKFSSPVCRYSRCRSEKSPG